MMTFKKILLALGLISVLMMPSWGFADTADSPSDQMHTTLKALALNNVFKVVPSSKKVGVFNLEITSLNLQVITITNPSTLQSAKKLIQKLFDDQSAVENGTVKFTVMLPDGNTVLATNFSSQVNKQALNEISQSKIKSIRIMVKPQK